MANEVDQMSEIDELLKAADRAMATNNLDAAESIVDSLLMKVKQAAGEEAISWMRRCLRFVPGRSSYGRACE